MSTITENSLITPVVFPANWTFADLQAHLGGVPASRIRLYPAPGTATEEDALRLDDHEDVICELVDGVLVEKVMSSYESYLAMILGHLLHVFLESHDQGMVLGEGGQLRILPTKMRVPDVSFIRWDRLPGGKLPTDRVFKIAPDLAVEILSDGNTIKEMELKLGEYFEAGVRLVWYIDPVSRTAQVYTSREQSETIDTSGTLDGGEVLPGFKLRLGELFERADRRR